MPEEGGGGAGCPYRKMSGKLQVAIGFLKNSRMDPSREVIRHLWELGVQTLLEGGLYRTPSLPMESSGSIYESVDIILRIQQNISTAQSAQGKQLTMLQSNFQNHIRSFFIRRQDNYSSQRLSCLIIIFLTPDRRQSRTILTIDERG